jgi:hypothetical protein
MIAYKALYQKLNHPEPVHNASDQSIVLIADTHFQYCLLLLPAPTRRRYRRGLDGVHGTQSWQVPHISLLLHQQDS